MGGYVEIIIDEQDKDLLDSKYFYVHIDGYIYTTDKITKKNKALHRLILERIERRELKYNEYCDHRDGNKTNNLRINLRISNASQNNANKAKRKDAIYSQYKGVKKGSKSKPFKATIKVGGVCIHLGVFTTEVEAAEAYDAAAKFHFKEFAKTNFF